MRKPFPYFTILLIVFVVFRADAAPAGPLTKHLSSILKWTAKTTSKMTQADAEVLQFEDGYLVETVVEGNDIGVVPYKIRVSEDGELFAVDEVNSNVVKITPPLSQYSRARLVAGSFQGYTGHVDGKPNEARFNHPKGVTMDDKGNVYVADTLNLAIRKIGDAGVTTIAGGKSNVAGYRDGPSEDAKFSNDFDVVYVHSTCSLLVVDRGNAALREISLNQKDCDYQSSSVTVTDILMVIGAVVAGYATCMLQQGFRPSFLPKMLGMTFWVVVAVVGQGLALILIFPICVAFYFNFLVLPLSPHPFIQQPSESEFKELPSKEKPTPIVDSMKEEPRWPSFGQLLVDLSKITLEALASVFLYFIPSWFRSNGPKKGGLTPLKDSLRMPEDEVEPPSVPRQTPPVSLSEARQIRTPNTDDKYSELKPPKIKSASLKDPSLSSKHRSSKRQEYADFYGSGDVPSHGRSKTHKEKTRHRQRDKSGEAVFGAVGGEPKPEDMKPVDYEGQKFDHYNMRRNKYGSDNSYRY